MLDHMHCGPRVWCGPLMVCEASFQRNCSSWASRYQNFAGTLGLSACAHVTAMYVSVNGCTVNVKGLVFVFCLGGAGAPDQGGGDPLTERSKTLGHGHRWLGAAPQILA